MSIGGADDLAGFVSVTSNRNCATDRGFPASQTRHDQELRRANAPRIESEPTKY
jgi:hypothetical protein